MVVVEKAESVECTNIVAAGSKDHFTKSILEEKLPVCHLPEKLLKLDPGIQEVALPSQRKRHSSCQGGFSLLTIRYSRVGKLRSLNC